MILIKYYIIVYIVFLKQIYNVFLYKNKNGSGHMEEKVNLEQRIIQLKLKKRDLVLAGKNTKEIDEEIKRIIKKCEEILDTESEDIKKIQRNITIKEDSEKYNLDIHINKKHDKLFKELLSDKKEAVKFINHYLHLNLLDDEIEKYEKEFRTEEFRNIEADVVYKVKNKNVFILIEHQSSLDLKMAYRILRYKNAIIESAINKRRLKEKNYKIPKVIPIVLYTGKRKWQKLSIEDIEEKIEGYEEIKPGYDLVDTNEFTKQQLLEDNLVTSKATLIEKSQNKEEKLKAKNLV